MRYLILALILLLAACGDDDDTLTDDGSAEAAVIRQFGYVDQGQWGREWDELHPLHQALVPKEHFVNCNSDNDFSVDNLRVIDVYEERVTLPGTDEEVDSTAVTVELTLSNGLLEDERRDTFHEVLVDDEWRWGMSDPGEYANGECP